MRYTLHFPILCAFLFFCNTNLFSQASACPQVTVAPAGPICAGNCVNLTATPQGSVATTSYSVSTIPYSPYSYTIGTPVLVNIDDIWTPVINLPFCFQFYGSSYTQFVIGSNGLISFNTAYANAFCQWQITSAIPGTGNPINSIMAPYHDIDPSIGSTSDTRYQVYGTAPCREMVISWYHIPMYYSPCNAQLASQQIVLHETTNIIDIYITDKPLCASWNVGAAIEGIQNAAGTLATVVPGRNYPTNWTATNDGKRFMPTGTPQYTLNWTGPSGSLGSANPITVCPTTTSTYTCTMTNTTCSSPVIVSASTTVSVTAGLTTSGAQTNSTSCVACNGTATTTVVTGTGPFTYAWLPVGGTGVTASNLCPGSYTCTVTNPTGCTGTQTFLITGPTAPTSTQAHTNVSCNGSCNGTATITPNPAGAYTYTWTPNVSSTATATALCAGTYTVTATDAGGCTTTQTITITQPPVLTATQSQTNISCNGGCNGTATVVPSGGTPGYTYSWAPSGGTGPTASSRCVGTYTCTITDANGCTITKTFSITQPPALTASSTSTPATCGGNTGTVTANPSGGSPGYTYSWNSVPVQNTQTATGLPAGSYTCTVTDLNGCTTTTIAVVGSTGGITGSIIASTNVSCFGGTNGNATAAPNGGSGPYVYAWNTTPPQSNATATNLPAGSYTCIITDANGCIATVTVAITQPPLLTATTSQVNELCNGGNTGTATVTPSGGTPNYSYSWNTVPVQTTATATGLTANSYICTITDANGCSITKTVTITQPTAVTASTSMTPSTCGNPNGTAIVTPGGGTPNYTYSWNTVPVQTTPTATGLLAGAYVVTVTDANGCSTTASITVTNTGGPTASISASTNISCFGGSNGSATVSVVGGVGPMGYSWNSTPIQTTPTATGLPIGTYIVTVSDANGCSATATVTLTQPPALTASASSTPVLCNGGNTGTATVTPGGGAPTYSYSWNSVPTQNTATATGLPTGSYTCTVTDSHGCTITASTTVTQPTALTTTVSQVNELCNGGNTGSATVTPAGGTPNYSYSWNTVPVQTTPTATGLTSGNYTCTITDANGCVLTATFNITQPTALSLTTSFVQSTCGSANGSATVNIAGGTPLYSVSWNTVPVQTTTTATNLLAGNYTATVTDANGCSLTATVNVPNAGSPTAVISSSTNVSCFGGNNGDATVTAGSGTAPYLYSWTTVPVQTTATATGLTVGTYTVTVTDDNGCTAVDTVTITEPPVLTISGSSTNVDCFGNTNGTASVVVGGGVTAYVYNWLPSGGSSANATGLAANSYTCNVSDANGCTISQSFSITEPPVLTLAVAGFNVSCFGSCDGQVVVIPAGGVPNYTFAWSTGCANPSCNAICAGSYTVTVNDQNGCVATASTTVTEPTAIVINTSEVDAHCNLSDGSASAVANGGTGALTYQWIGGPANANYNNIPAATYSVIVTDANGCADTATTTVNNLNGVNASLTSVTNLTCFNSNNGAIVTSAAGGTIPYTYSWTAPALSLTGSASSLSAGSYTLTVTDASGCISTVSATVTQPTDVTLAASATPPAVCAGAGVQLSAVGAGGVPGYTYSWLPGPLVGGVQNIIPASTTTYSVYVFDANGCSDSSTVLVTVNPVPVAALTSDVTSGCAPLCVNLTDLSSVTSPGVIASGSWDYGDGSPLGNLSDTAHCFVNAGPYSITLNVITTDGCTSTIVMPAYINVFANPVAAFGASPQPTTILNPEIFFTDSSLNATSWSWSFGDIANGSSSLQNPSFTYSDPTCYEVVLAVASMDGCVDTATKEICIGPDATIYVPNAFTPNDDGVNDFFFPVGLGIDPDKYEMWIFDRWGNMIFYTDDLAKGWDGRVTGHEEISQIDTYVWKIKAYDILGNKNNFEGKVSIVK